jgi:putative ABC transport system permease protein
VLLRWFCPEHLYEEIEGDLIQRYRRDVVRFGARRAKWRLVWSVVRFCRPGILLRNRVSRPEGYFMLAGNYFMTSYRHVRKHKVNALFKLTGLTLAMFSFLIIALYVVFQLSFDRYHEGYESIYRVNASRKENGVPAMYAVTPRPLGPMLRAVMPDIKTYTRVISFDQRFIRHRQETFSSQILRVDSSFFDVFTFRFISGSRRALTHSRSIVLTQTLAAKLFGSTDPVNQPVTFANGDIYEVTGVVEDVPVQSHLWGDAFVSMDADDGALTNASVFSPVEFIDHSAMLYVRFNADADVRDLSEKLQSVMDKILPARERAESGFALALQPLKDIYLDASLKFEVTSKGSVMYLWFFIALAFFLLLVATVNYINLSVADFAGRMREMGIRKIMGAAKIQIAFQVVLEGVAYCTGALTLALVLLYLGFPAVIQFVDSRLRFDMLFQQDVVIAVTIITLVLILGATVIPSWRIARGKSAGDLKAARGAGQGSGFSHALLAVQFVVSVLCMGATWVMARQLHFIHDKDLGFNRKNLQVLQVPDQFSVRQMQAFKRELQAIPGVERVSNSSFKVGDWYWKDWYNVEVDGQMKPMELYEVFSDDDMFETLGLKLIAGRTFREDYPADSGAAFVINETVARELGWTDAVGKRINTHTEEPGKWDGTVVGVVGDIHIGSLHEKVQPLVMRLPWQNRYPGYFVYIRTHGPAQAVREAVAQRYRAMMPGYPLEMDEVDAFYNSGHAREERAFVSLQAGSFVVVLIAAFGIFSLSMYMSVRRMKEFGIRKMLGASVGQISFLHISQFLKIVMVANVIALPVADWLMNAWLDRFAYHATAPLWIFLVVAALSVVLVVLSAGYASWRSGRLNPVEVIRNQ